jgi:uncharacterized beta-barrel protein YwiB (DUF1934 family)
MIEDIVLKITNNQREIVSGKKDEIFFFTEGKSEQSGDTLKLFYEESDDFGPTGGMTELVIKQNDITMKRPNAEDQAETIFVFEKGKRYHSQYITPFGNIPVEILTRNIERNLDEHGRGSVGIDYEISLEGLSENHNSLKIEIQ